VAREEHEMKQTADFTQVIDLINQRHAEQVAAIQSLRSEQASAIENLRTELRGEQGAVRNELSWLSRTVNAIDRAPAPYSRPKTFVTATEMNSVSHPVRVKVGHQG
jgi:hypothetical protein